MISTFLKHPQDYHDDLQRHVIRRQWHIYFINFSLIINFSPIDFPDNKAIRSPEPLRYILNYSKNKSGHHLMGNKNNKTQA